MAPAPPPASGSTIVIAKLFVPLGGFDHDNCGDMFSPTQFGFCGLLAWLLAIFCGIIVPSLNIVDVKVNGSAAVAAVHNEVRTSPPAARTTATFVIMMFPPPRLCRRWFECSLGGIRSRHRKRPRASVLAAVDVISSCCGPPARAA